MALTLIVSISDPMFLITFLGSAFRAGLMHQCYNMPDVDMIFTVMEATPDLSQIFEQKKRRFYKRTSSAQWGNAPVTHKY